jgi:hypothetical protein
MPIKPTIPIIDPMLLKAVPRRSALNVFVCGPGETHPFYHARKHIRQYLQSAESVHVTFGEDLLSERGLPAGDLQTVESAQADKSDFTILLVDSPGSIAELGSFSTSEFLRHRLFAIIPSEYYESSSYIARGPLSVLAKQFQHSVIYFDRKDFTALSSAVMIPVAMFKFIASKYGRSQRPYLSKKLFFSDRQKYFRLFLDERAAFLSAFTLAAIHISDNPSFTELVSLLGISPMELKSTLRRLFEAQSIEKRSGRYVPLKGYSDALIALLNSTAVSLRRAQFLVSNR